MFEDSDDIHDFINTEVRRELEADLERMGENPRQDYLINSLPKRKWKLEAVNLDEVRMDPLVVNSTDVKTGRSLRSD